MSDLDRFVNSIHVTMISGCWLWLKATDKDGYGLFKIGSRSNKSRRMIRAHRWAYETFREQISEGLQIDHLCRNPSCVNPSHCEPVTPLVNTRRGWRANKRQCKHGHPLEGTNLYRGPDGRRACRICRKRWAYEHGLRTNWSAQREFKRRRQSALGMS